MGSFMGRELFEACAIKVEYGQPHEMATAFGVRELGIPLANPTVFRLSPLESVGLPPVSPLNWSLPAVSRAPALQRLRRSDLCARFNYLFVCSAVIKSTFVSRSAGEVLFFSDSSAYSMPYTAS